jgi:hypothetical protein
VRRPGSTSEGLQCEQPDDLRDEDDLGDLGHRQAEDRPGGGGFEAVQAGQFALEPVEDLACRLDEG